MHLLGGKSCGQDKSQAAAVGRSDSTGRLAGLRVLPRVKEHMNTVEGQKPGGQRPCHWANLHKSCPTKDQVWLQLWCRPQGQGVPRTVAEGFLGVQRSAIQSSAAKAPDAWAPIRSSTRLELGGRLSRQEGLVGDAGSPQQEAICRHRVCGSGSLGERA
jgi:hypothetical protein